MDGARGKRLIRGLLAAGIATFVALLSHVGAGASMPGTVGILVPLVLSIVVSVFLTGRKLSATRLSLAVLISQAFFHVLFVLGAGGRVQNPPMGGPGHQHAPVDVDIVATVSAAEHAAHLGPLMWGAHALAAALTVLALYRGEAALRALFLLAALSIIAWLRALVSIAVPRRTRAAACPDTPHALVPLGVYVSTLAHRGPPEYALAA
ncbi:hypothetical protein D9V32_09565 [Mycetocola tolaasinivorans]|uniref:Uncharacterized protein n=1 Tax=Mycetocola tolaasinivorans TaxID=76635 RepID=A0A3L7A6J7_9MICO|nr:hypothetical protein [Mycetocola tolaasinivorans]RLP75705.1 hypothetical protein D9V32_09565 [Mycetocola tolaasinivorans]